MSEVYATNEPCPCDSALRYDTCCGGETTVRANIDDDGLLCGHDVTPRIERAHAAIACDPTLFPARFDFENRRAQLINMSPHWYRESVFLDPPRIRGRYAIDASIAGLERLLGDRQAQPAVFIFHTAFCGSTLMSQALDALYEGLPLREPEVLGNLLLTLRAPQIDASCKQRAYHMVLHMLTRRYETTQPAVIKANDYANPMMLEIIAREPTAPLLFMYVPLREFVIGCLRAPSRRDWIRQRYHAIRAAAAPFFAATDATVHRDDAFGEMAAFYWAYNVALFRRAQSREPRRVRSLDFNTMLIDPLAATTASAQHFALAPRSNVDAAPILRRLFGAYSKNKSYPYSPQQREQDLRDFGAIHSAQIDAAHEFARRLLNTHDTNAALPGALAI